LFAEAFLVLALAQAPVLSQAPVIKAGDRVRVVIREAGVEVTLTAIAEQSGRPDQIIRVINPSSRRAIHVRVVAAGEVELANAR
jgi:flagella basal body P-ring formation protein FlgA